MNYRRVNRSLMRVLLLPALACTGAKAPAGGAETPGAAERRDTATIATTAPKTDPIVTRADLGRILGDSTAKVWVIVVSDFQCPYCRQWHHESYSALRDEYVTTGKVRLAFVNYPLSQHANALPAAQAAMCAGEQGKFWQMHDAIFVNQARWASLPSVDTLFASLARGAGVDTKRWSACLASDAMRPLIQADQSRTSAAGVRQTPSFLIGERLLAGAVPMTAMRATIDSALAEARSGSRVP
ncbi:MAG TPA: thioredoxin domain-containing protein [Gemmatimonadaceae bacterium]|nr:thioredoxin domain-containing protein [Gemmatimonadaceae bacterium]